MPTGGEGSGLGLAVADDRGDEQTWIVERSSIGVGECVAEFAALMDRPGGLRGDMGGYSTGKRELPKQSSHALGVSGDVGIGLGVGAVEVGASHQSGTAVPRAGDVDGGLSAIGDHPIEMCVEKVESRCGAPVAEQSGFDVFAAQWGSQQRVVEKVDLPDGEIIGGAPPTVDRGNHLVGECVVGGLPGCGERRIHRVNPHRRAIGLIVVRPTVDLIRDRDRPDVPDLVAVFGDRPV